MSKVQVMDHPLIQHKMSYIRDEKTSTKEFRELVDEVGMLMAYEVTRDLTLEDVSVQTPVQETTAKRLSGKKLGIVPILRAGLGMQDGILKLIPSARVGHIGLYRDPETLEAVEYYAKFPGDIEERDIFVIDPMLATGASAVEAITAVKKHRGDENSFYLSDCSAGRCGCLKRSTSGCRHLYRGTR
jgi:Uracil phosphoribosyltransferase